MNLKLKNANISDAEYLFELANNKLTRQNSFNSKRIEWSEHLSWLANKLNDSNNFIYVITQNDKPVGTVKIEISNDETIIGITVDPAYRGIGLGVEIIKIGCEEFWKSKDNAISAYIKKDNSASIKVFKKANFIHSKILRLKELGSVKLTAKKNGN